MYKGKYQFHKTYKFDDSYHVYFFNFDTSGPCSPITCIYIKNIENVYLVLPPELLISTCLIMTADTLLLCLIMTAIHCC